MIETERLVLRRPEPGDLAWRQEWLNTAAVMRFLGGAVRTPEQVAAGFARDFQAWEQGEPSFFTVVLREDGEIVGRCGLSRIGEGPAPDRIRGAIQVGWTFAEPFWGKGFAFEAAQAAIAFGFGTYQVPELWAQTSDSNQASTRLMLRLGMTRCSDLCYRDPDYPPTENPTIVYRLGRDRWVAKG